MRKFLTVLSVTCHRCHPPVAMVCAGPGHFICPQCENVCRIALVTPPRKI